VDPSTNLPKEGHDLSPDPHSSRTHPTTSKTDGCTDTTQDSTQGLEHLLHHSDHLESLGLHSEEGHGRQKATLATSSHGTPRR